MRTTQSSTVERDSENKIDPATRLPIDVLPLVKELGVSKGLVCALMSFAREQGQQGVLGSIVKLFWLTSATSSAWSRSRSKRGGAVMCQRPKLQD